MPQAIERLFATPMMRPRLPFRTLAVEEAALDSGIGDLRTGRSGRSLSRASASTKGSVARLLAPRLHQRRQFGILLRHLDVDCDEEIAVMTLLALQPFAAQAKLLRR